jgi:hypothetical protein
MLCASAQVALLLPTRRVTRRRHAKFCKEEADMFDDKLSATFLLCLLASSGSQVSGPVVLHPWTVHGVLEAVQLMKWCSTIADVQGHL